jgi:hypothetical protein
MARNDQAAGPKIGQVVLYQVATTHLIIPAIIKSLGASGTVNLTTFPAGAVVAEQLAVPFGGALDGATAAFDNKWGYVEFF